MLTRAAVVGMSICLTGCLSMTHHRNLGELSLQVQRVNRGALRVTATDGSQTRFEAPYVAVAEEGVLYVQPHLLPIQTFEEADIAQVDVTQFSPVRTGVAVGVGVLVAGAVAGAIGLGFALKGAQFLRPFPPGWF